MNFTALLTEISQISNDSSICLSTDLNKVDFGLEKAIASALANMISNPTAEKIVPGVFDDGVVNTVVKAVQHYASQKNND